MSRRFFMDDYVLNMGDPNSKEYKQAMGRLELEKLDEIKRQREENERIREEQLIQEEKKEREKRLQELEKLREKAEKELEKIEEEEKYRFRRNQQIFDKIGVDYNLVDNFLNHLKIISNHLESEPKINTEKIDAEKEEKENQIKENENNIRIIDETINSNDNIMVKNIFWLLTSICICLMNINGILNVLGFCCSAFLILAIIVNLYHFFDERSKLRFYSRKQTEAEEEYKTYCDKYEGEIKNQISNIKSEQMKDFKVLKKRYEKIIEEWQRFRSEQYNKEFETALKLIGIKDENKLNEDKGTIQNYEMFIENKINELYSLNDELDNFIEKIESIEIDI